MLNVVSIQKRFAKKSVLHNVTFTAPNAQLTVIEGKNGAGKSTLFNILSGVITSDGGTMTIDDRDINAMSSRERAVQIAVLRQDPTSITVAAFSVLENAALMALKIRRAGFRDACSQSARVHARTHFDELGLTYVDDLDKPLAQFSGGQRQMLAFALATMIKPGLLLLDEPTAALDEHSGEILMELVKRFLTKWQIPAIMISHDHELNRRYADAIFVLRDGILHESMAS